MIKEATLALIYLKETRTFQSILLLPSQLRTVYAVYVFLCEWLADFTPQPFLLFMFIFVHLDERPFSGENG